MRITNKIMLNEYPLNHDLISKLPKKLMLTFRSVEVKVTSFDFTNTHIIFGTNAGCGFLLNRDTGHVIKLLCQLKQDYVTCVKLLNGLECQVVLATKTGKLSIVIFSETTVGSKQVQKFSVDQVHNASISSLAWSVNGMKLYSGDVNGNIFCQEIDFKNKTCSSSFILREETEIIQMEYCQKLLLVSTLENSFLLHNGEKKMIGTKFMRKGKYGACFNSNAVIESELKVLATRPGMRVWLSDINGTVMMTLKMKDIVESSSSYIKLTNLKNSVDDKDLAFGMVMAFGADCLVTYHGSSLYVIDHQLNKIVAEVHNLSNVLQVQVTDTEIIILCSDTLLHRIAYEPDRLFIGRTTHDGQDGFTMQDMKESLSGVRKSITPMLGSIQSKMPTLNVESFTTKIQAQASDFKKKVSSIPISGVAERFMTSHRRSSSDSTESSHSQPVALADDTNHNLKETVTSPHHNEDDDTLLIIKQILNDLVNLVEANSENQTYLCEPDLKFVKDDIDAQSQSKSRSMSQSQKGFRYDHIDIEKTEKLVFSSKLRKKKVHKALRTPSNGSDVCRKKSFTKDVHDPSQMCDQESDIDPNKNELLSTSAKPHASEVSLNCQVKDELTDSTSSATPPITDEAQPSGKPPNTRGDEKLISSSTNDQSSSIPEDTLVSNTSGNEKLIPSSTNDQSSSIPEDTLVSNTSGNEKLIPSSTNDQSSYIPKDTLVSNTSGNEKLIPSSTNDQSSSIPEDTLVSNTSGDEKLIPFSTNDQSSYIPEDTLVSNTNQSTDLPLFDSDVCDVEEDAISDATCSSKSDEDPDHAGTSSGSYKTQHQNDDQYFNAVKLNPEFYVDSEVSPKSSDRWTVNTVPSGSLHRLEGSERIICFINAKHHAYCVEESSSHQLIWNKFSKKAMHIAVSPSGDFAWLVTTKGNVYTAPIPVVLTNDPQKSVEIDLDWILVGRDATFACLGLTEGWIIDFDGKVLRVTGLSRSEAADHFFQPVDIRFIDSCFITSAVKAIQLALTNAVVWLLNADGRVLCKPLASLNEHSNWDSVEPICTDYDDDEQAAVHFITSDYQKTMWVVDSNHRLWFRSNVTSSNPEGDQWWQTLTADDDVECKKRLICCLVYLNEYLYQEQRDRLFPSIPHPDFRTDPTSWLSGSAAANSVAVSLCSVWVASNSQNLHVARGAITGNQWRLVRMAGIASSVRWSYISSSSIFSPECGTWKGLIWVAQENGDVICFTSQSDIFQVTAIPSPAGTSSLLAVSASREAVWMLYQSGGLYARSGISSNTPTGVEWRHVDVSIQLGDIKLVHVSCGSLCVWAVDEEGKVYVRMGVNVTRSHKAMAPAWLSIESCNFPDRQFVQITCGPSDINVWAVDDHGSTYVRTGVRAEVPIGERWKIVQGPPVERITVSNHAVWALCKEGSILRRCGITHSDCMGDYWKKIPGNFKNLTATPYDELWAIDAKQRLRRHVTQLYCPPLLEAMRDDVYAEAESSSRVADADNSWKIL